MIKRGLLGAAVLSAAALAYVPAAGAAIVVGDNIAGGKPGMSLAQLKKVWGKPSDTGRSSGHLITADWERSKLYALFSISTPTAHSVSTQSPKQVTAEGIHVGSTAAATQAAYPTADCTARSCFLFVDGGVSTSFNFTRGKVDSIAMVGP
jgi:hypothetical protein